MEKLKLVLLVFILYGCSNHHSVACEKDNGNIKTYIEIQAINDDITLINIKEVFVIDYDLLMNKEIKSFLDGQIDSSYYYHDNKLIKEYSIIMDDRYSFSKTLEQFKKEKYICE